MKKEFIPEIGSVGVFVNEAPEQIAKLAGEGVLDLIQLHGDEDASYIRQLKELTDKPVIKAVRVKSTEDILKAQELPAEYLLLDTYREGEYGGSGKTFSWEMIPNLSKPYFLAGVLDSGNVCGALRKLRLWAVDVSSSVETDGHKDDEKVKKFIDAVQAAN